MTPAARHPFTDRETVTIQIDESGTVLFVRDEPPTIVFQLEGEWYAEVCNDCGSNHIVVR